MKRVYIASKVGLMNEAVQQLKVELEQRGFVIPCDWTQMTVPQPYDSDEKASGVAAHTMAQAVKQCDVIIVLCAKGGRGYHIETGGALIASIILSEITGQKQKEIYVVGKDNNRSVFYFHPLVRRVATVEELLQVLSNAQS